MRVPPIPHGRKQPENHTRPPRCGCRSAPGFGRGDERRAVRAAGPGAVEVPFGCHGVERVPAVPPRRVGRLRAAGAAVPHLGHRPPGQGPVEGVPAPPLSADKSPSRRPTASTTPCRSRARETSSAKAAAACDPADFTGRTGSELVRFIKASTTGCVNTLFSLTCNNAQLAFREARMISVAYALRDNAASCPGDGSTGTPQRVLYLRAGYYVQWYNPDVVGPYGRTRQPLGPRRLLCAYNLSTGQAAAERAAVPHGRRPSSWRADPLLARLYLEVAAIGDRRVGLVPLQPWYGLRGRAEPLVSRTPRPRRLRSTGASPTGPRRSCR